MRDKGRGSEVRGNLDYGEGSGKDGSKREGEEESCRKEGGEGNMNGGEGRGKRGKKK